MKKFFCVIFTVILMLPGVKATALNTSASSAVLINGDSGEIIYSQNCDERLPMASTTKIMTALLLAEQCEPDTVVTVTREMVAVEGSSMGLLVGDSVTYNDLLYGMMLASGNDAANTTAIALGGTVENFVKMMNEKAGELGLVNTHFVTPSGLDADGHYTTAYELAMLARYAMSNEAFFKAASSKTATLCYGNPPYKRSLSNHNRLLKCFDGAVGVKTGFTKKSGRCLVSAAKRDGKYVIAVTLNDPNDWDDHTSLLEYGLSQIKQSEYSPDITEYLVPVVNGEADCLLVQLNSHTINTVNTGDVSCTVKLPKLLYAPVTEGDTIGTAEYMINNIVIDTVELKASVGIKKNKIQNDYIYKFFNNLKYITQFF